MGFGAAAPLDLRPGQPGGRVRPARAPLRAPAAAVVRLLRPDARGPAHVAGDQRPADRALLPRLRADLLLHAGVHADHHHRDPAVHELVAGAAGAADGAGAAGGGLALQPPLQPGADRRAAARRRGDRDGRGERRRHPGHQGVRPRVGPLRALRGDRPARVRPQHGRRPPARPLPAADGLPADRRPRRGAGLRRHPDDRRRDDPRRVRGLLPLPDAADGPVPLARDAHRPGPARGRRRHEDLRGAGHGGRRPRRPRRRPDARRRRGDPRSRASRSPTSPTRPR